MEPAGSHQHGDTVKRLLDQARSAIQASNAAQALQCVIEALKLVRGDNAVIPTLRHAAEQYHAQRSAPIDEISALLAHVSLQAGQQLQQQAPSHIPQPTMQQYPQHQHEQRHQQQVARHQQQMCGAPGSQAPQQHGWQGAYPSTPSQQQQQQALRSNHCPDSAAILSGTGREEYASFALADGSSWQCPHCAGVVSVQRKQAHLQAWCPQLQLSNSSSSQDDMVQ